MTMNASNPRIYTLLCFPRLLEERAVRESAWSSLSFQCTLASRPLLPLITFTSSSYSCRLCPSQPPPPGLLLLGNTSPHSRPDDRALVSQHYARNFSIRIIQPPSDANHG